MAASTSEALARRRATYRDVLDAPAHQVAEIVDGTLHTHPRPAPPHAVATSYLEIELGAPFSKGRGGPGGWWIIFEPELHLGEDILVPDLAAGAASGCRTCRIRRTSSLRRTGCAKCCRLRPAGSTCMASARSMPAKALRTCGLVDPTDRTLEAFELREGEWVLIGTAKDDEPVSVRPFDAITFSLGDLWP